MAKRGRPSAVFDLALVQEYAARGLTAQEIADSFGVSRSTVQRHKRNSATFDAAIKRGRAQGHATVAGALMDRITAGDTTAIIWYEKTRRGLADRVRRDSVNLTLTLADLQRLSDEQLRHTLQQLLGDESLPDV